MSDRVTRCQTGAVRVAVTGSTGFIGQALIKGLAAAGHEPVPVIRSAPTDSMASLRWDPASGRIDRDGLEGIDAAVHLAGESIGRRRWSEAQKQRISTSRTRSTALLAETMAGLENRPGVLMSASAIGIYGSRGNEVLTEASPPGTDFLATVCRDWEAAADPARAAGIRVVHPRIGVVLDPSGGALGNLLPVFRLGLGGRIGDGRQWMSWITLPDAVSALVWLLTVDAEGPVNLTAPAPVTNLELTETLGRVLRRPARLITPKPVLWARLGRELTETLLYSSARVEPVALQRHRFEFAHPELESGLRSVLEKTHRS